MAKFRFMLSIGYPSAVRDEVIEIPDAELAGLTQVERDSAVQQQFEYWKDDHIDSTWEEVED